MSLILSSCLALSLFFSLQAQTLTVAAAADLSKVAPELAQSFEKANPTIKIKFVSESSAMLSQQIENGAPYDLFMSANAKFVDDLAKSGKLTESKTYASGRVALLWRDGKQHDINDLADGQIRFIAIANPKLAPYGVAAQQALEHANLWPKVQSKIVFGENVRQTLQLFDSGNADAVLTSGGLVADRQAQILPAGWHQPLIQKAGIIATSAKQKEADMFLQFLLGSSAQAIFAKYGYGKPTP